MSRPIKELPTLTGEAAANFLKRADAAERRYKERKEAGTLRDITKDPGYISRFFPLIGVIFGIENKKKKGMY